MSTWGLFVPTYKKKDIAILSFLGKDKNIVINLCVRPEEDDTGFYDEFKVLDRVNVIRLNYGLHDLGETRQNILEYCKENDIKYCFQFDDGLTNVVDDYTPEATISEIFEGIVEIMNNDSMSEIMAGFTFTKRNVLEAHPEEFKNRDYFTFFATQATCINVELAFANNIKYGRLDEEGFEDASFYGDTLKAGLVWGGRRNIIIEGVIPNKLKEGGSHSNQTLKQLEEKYDRCNLLTIKHLNNMMGVSIQKRYRSHIGCALSFLIWDLDYFYKILVTDRHKNQDVINNRLEVNYGV